jgi:REP element-mobilizing transposase RayT
MVAFYKGYNGLRKKGFDYSTPGFYFVTIDCHRGEWHFGFILKQRMTLSEFGQIAYSEWLKLPSRYPHLKLHIFQFMPNHFHAIVELMDVYSNEADNSRESIITSNSMLALHHHESLSDILGGYKSIVSNECLRIHKEKFKEFKRVPILGKIWQRSFFDKIIIDKPMFKSIARYIRNNPKKWNRL